MNGDGTLTEQVRVAVAPGFKRRLKDLARKQRRSLSSAVRVLLEEAMELEDTLAPLDPHRVEYEIVLTVKQAAHFVRQGYDLQVWEPEYSQMPLL